MTAGRTPHAKSIPAKSITAHADARADRGISFDDFQSSAKKVEEDDHADADYDVVLSHKAEERSLHVDNVINPRGINRRQADKLYEKDNSGQDVAHGERPPPSARSQDPR